MLVSIIGDVITSMIGSPVKMSTTFLGVMIGNRKISNCAEIVMGGSREYEEY